MNVDWKNAQPLLCYTVTTGEFPYQTTEMVILEWPDVMIASSMILHATELATRERGGFRIKAANAEAFYLEYESRGFPDRGEFLLGLVYSNVEPRPDVEATKDQVR